MLRLLTWIHLSLIEPVVRWWEEVVLGSWEEWILALVRQGFEETTRFLNGLATWFLALFSKHRYRDQLRRAWQENSWQQWWGEASTRPSTLNALVANLVAQQNQKASTGPDAPTRDGSAANGTPPPPPPVLPNQPASGPHSPHGGQPSRDGHGQACNGRSSSSRTEPSGPAPVQPRRGGGWWFGKRTPPAPRGRVQGQAGSRLLAARLERPAVFVQQSGMGILDELAKRRHGLIEDAKMAAQLAVSRAFDFVRAAVRAVFLLPSRETLAARRGGFAPGPPSPAASHWRASPAGPATVDADGCGGGAASADGAAAAAAPGAGGGGLGGPHRVQLQRSKSAHVNIAEMAYQPGAGAGASANMSRRGLRRSRSYSRLHSSHHADAPSDTLSVIRAAGYPHELHTVTTADGYVLRLERIPRVGARDVVVFVHGVLDTSMAWVSGGVTGSQAFAAWEAGLDVWMCNSRGNAPRQHQDPARRGSRYWQYSNNHMGMYDMAAQLDHLHNVKCAELGAGTVTLDLDHLGPLADSFLGGRGGRDGRGAAASRQPTCDAHGLPGRAVSTMEAGGGMPGAGLRGTSRMRQSNSDGNLHRWSSIASASSTRGDNLGGVLDGAAACRAGEPAPHANLPTPAALLRHSAESTPPQPPPDRVPSSLAAGPLPCASAGCASLGQQLSSHGLLLPSTSCDLSGDEEPELQVQAGGEPPGSMRAAEPSHPAPPRPEAGPSTGSATAADGRGSHRSSATSSQLTPLSRNTVTLTVQPSTTPDAPKAAPTTFTLEAKTRVDFWPMGSPAHPGPAPPASPAPHPSVGLPRGSGPCMEAGGAGCGGSGRVDHESGRAEGGPHHAPSTAAAMLESVTQAMTSAAATAGAAFATAAASASQLLLASPQRSSAQLPAASPATPSASRASPFAVASAQDLSAGLVAAEAGAVGGTSTASGEGVPSPRAADGSWRLGARAAPLPPPHSLQEGAARSLLPASVPVHPELAPARQTPTAAAAAPSAPHGSAATDGDCPFAPCSPARPAGPTDQPSDRPTSGSGSRALERAGPPAAASSFRRASSTTQLYRAAAAGWGGAGARTGVDATLQMVGLPERAGSGASSGLRSAAGSGCVGDGGMLPLSEPGGMTGQAVGQAAAAGRGVAAAAAPRVAGQAAGTPYKLRCVAHSLGGMSVLIHLVNRLREGRPHHISRLVLLTPAGFHKHFPTAAKPIAWALPTIARVLRALFGRSFSFPFYIPTPLGRALTFKLLLSASRIPGLGELLRVAFKAMLDGDISQWDRALQMPHYNTQDMPAISLDQVLHLIQLVHADSFRLYDYGSPAANAAHYGCRTPPSVSAEYWRLDLPVHLVAGRRDGIIPPPNIRQHLDAMRAQGVAVSYREFDFGHLDFTFGVKEELRMYLSKLLRL